MAVSSTTRSRPRRPIDDSYATILDLERVIPCVEGGSVLEATSPDSVKAEIKVKMGAMSMTFTGTVEVVEQDAAAHTRADARQVEGGRRPGPRERRRRVRARRRRRHDPHQRADHGKAASMGEGVVAGVLDALIRDFSGKLSAL